MADLRFLWLELTGKCQLACVHCYADSGPTGTHGPMTAADWNRVIDESVGLGVEMIQFIGGETLHPDLPELLARAVDEGLEVEVFSNFVHVTPALWELFSRPGVRLAYSYYSDIPAQHAKITGRVGSHARTRENIAEAVRRRIPLRAGVIDVQDGQRARQAVLELADLGVTEVGVDRLRQEGRGLRDQPASIEQLCGNCAQGVAAVGPDGSVWPCVFSRWLPVGNVRDESLAEILAGPAITATRSTLERHFAARPTMGKDPCDPQCGPNCSPACNPQCWPTGSGPCGPKGGCQPNYD